MPKLISPSNPRHRNRLPWRPLGAALVLVWLLAGLLFLAATRPAAAQPLVQTATVGQDLFQQKCKACHTIGGGTLVGPDLQGVTARQDAQWLQGFIAAPDKYLASDPIAKQLLAQYKVPMPNLGLTADQVNALVAFLETQTGAATAGVTPAPAAQPLLPPGDPLIGRKIFRGDLGLTNAGLPCISCHNVGDLDGLAGGRLGPDLTHVLQRYGGQVGLASALAGLPFPTMQGVFATRPLTPQEQADLLAYFIQADRLVSSTAPVATAIFWSVGGFGTLLLFGVMLVYWPRQRFSMAEILRNKK